MIATKKYGVCVSNDAGWLDGCPDYEGVFFGVLPSGAYYVSPSEGSELGGHVEFDSLEQADAFARRLATSGDWAIKATDHPDYGRESRPEYHVAVLSDGGK